MKISDDTLSKIHDISIVTVAEKLGMKLYGTGNEGRRACCPYHEDQHPSLHFSTKRGCFKCFVCGAKGDAIKLVQDQENLSFTEACDWLIREFSVSVVPDAQPMNHGVCPNDSSAAKIRGTDPCDSSGSSRAVTSALIPLPSSLVDRSLSIDSVFCRALVSNGYLTPFQMQHAASRYKLGLSKDGAVVFWQIDEKNRVRTGKLMYYQPDCHRIKSKNPTWVHTLMQSTLPSGFELHRCLFGQHLLNSHPDPLMGRGYLNERATGGAVKPSHIGEGLDGVDVSFSSFLCAREKDRLCIVESEKTAIILSELFPDFIWLACGGLQMFSAGMLAPLVDYKIILFPDTDTTGETYNKWKDIATQALKLYQFKYPLRISSLLESEASPVQKAKKIDIVDFLFEATIHLE